MARLAHTEYFIEVRSSRGVREILRETMFAPTVTAAGTTGSLWRSLCSAAVPSSRLPAPASPHGRTVTSWTSRGRDDEDTHRRWRHWRSGSGLSIAKQGHAVTVLERRDTFTELGAP
jgi:hypothetical protein